jgi:predicted lipoprotein with Yx(FWY)xxD motif
MHLRTVLAATALSFAAVFAAHAQSASTIQLAESPELGAYLVDQNGMSLYLFEEDRRDGERGRTVESDCVTDDCLSRWPPLGGDPLPVAGEGIDASLIGAFVRPDGKSQAMYNGWPLYTFAEDFVAGDINGHDFEEFGVEWYLLTPAGDDVGNRNHESGDDRGDDRDDAGADD